MAHSFFVAQRQGANLWQISVNVHGAGTSNACEAAVHIGANAACPGTVRHLAGPELLVGKFFSNVFCYRQRIPYGQITIDQHGHFAHGVDVFQGLLEFGLRVESIKAHHHFFKINARLLEQDPRAHGP